MSVFLNEIDFQDYNHLEMLTIIAPKIAKDTPIIFLEVMGSFKKTLAKIIINTVESWLYIAASLQGYNYILQAKKSLKDRFLKWPQKLRISLLILV